MIYLRDKKYAPGISSTTAFLEALLHKPVS